MIKTVKIQPAPNLVGKGNASFNKEDYSALVWNKGYVSTIENAVKCPCKTKNNDHLSTCQNCLGTGWIFINKIQDMILFNSINSNTEFKNWSAEMIGTISITTESRSFLSYMDKITILDSRVMQSQILYPISFGTNYFAYTIYDIDDIVEIFKFVSPSSKLQKLELGIDYTFERNKILFTSIPTEDYVVSVRYYHKLVYGVIDIPHVIRNSYRKNKPTGRNELQILPVNAIGRLWHYIVDAQNFTGDNIFDNSYQLV